MATLLQFNRIQTNRENAVGDVERRLGESLNQGETRINVADASVPTTVSRRNQLIADINVAGTSGTGTINVARLDNTVVNNTNVVARLNASSETATIADTKLSSTGDTALIRRSNISGPGVNIDQTTGNIRITPFNINSIVTFRTNTLRNASIGPNNVAGTADANLWHRGDFAIVFGDRDLGAPTTIAVVPGSSNRQFTITFAAAPAPALTAGTVLSLVGGTPAAFNVDYTVVSGSGVSYVVSTENAVVGFYNSGGIVYASDDDSTTRGTYVFTSADQTTAAITTDTDWSLLQSPTDEAIDARQIRTGRLDAARLPADIATTGRLLTGGRTGANNADPGTTVVTNVSIDSATNALVFRDADDDITLTYSEANITPEVWLTAATGTLGAPVAGLYTFALSTGSTSVGQTLLRPAPGNTYTRRAFPTNPLQVQVFINGMKLNVREVTLGSVDAENPSNLIRVQAPLVNGARVTLPTDLAEVTVEVIILTNQ